MSIKIVLPSGKAPKACRGTKIYTEDGHEIKGVTGCNIEIMPDGVVMARLSVFVEDVENLDEIKGQVTIVNIAQRHNVVVRSGPAQVATTFTLHTHATDVDLFIRRTIDQCGSCKSGTGRSRLL